MLISVSWVLPSGSCHPSAKWKELDIPRVRKLLLQIDSLPMGDGDSGSFKHRFLFRVR